MMGTAAAAHTNIRQIRETDRRRTSIQPEN